jgi:hypothetical protein
MSNARKVPYNAKTVLVFGMTWKAMDVVESRAKQINAERVNGAAYQCSLKLDGDEFLGTCREFDTEGPERRTLVSAAAQLANHPDIKGKTVLFLHEVNGEPFDEPHVAVVFLKQGEIIEDAIYPVSGGHITDLRGTFFDQAPVQSDRGSVQDEYDGQVIGVVHTADPVGPEFTFDQLMQVRAPGLFKKPYKVVRLKSEAPPWLGWAIGGAVVVFALGFAGVQGWQYYRQQQAVKEAERQRQLLSPAVKYDRSRAEFLAHTEPLARDSAAALLDAIGSVPQKLAGWNFAQADCSFATGSEDVPVCHISWKRSGGTFATMRDAIAGTGMTGLALISDEAVSTDLPVKFKRQAHQPPEAWLQKGKWEIDERSVWQRWRDQSLPIEFAPLAVEAAPADGSVSAEVIETFPVVFYSARWTIKDSPLRYIDLMALLPASSTLDSITIKPGAAPAVGPPGTSSKGASLMMTATGRVFIAKTLSQ